MCGREKSALPASRSARKALGYRARGAQLWDRDKGYQVSRECVSANYTAVAVCCCCVLLL